MANLCVEPFAIKNPWLCTMHELQFEMDEDQDALPGDFEDSGEEANGIGEAAETTEGDRSDDGDNVEEKEDEEDEVGLMVVTEGSVRTEKWEVGRIKKAKKVNVTLPQGGVTVAALLFTWQKLDAGGKASMDALDDLSLDVAGCGPKGEWVMVEPKLIALGRGSAAGRPVKTKEPAQKKRKT